MLEAFMGHQVAWEYFENKDPYMAFVKEVCTGDEFFKRPVPLGLTRSRWRTPAVWHIASGG
jgi:hypothetical protein